MYKHNFYKMRKFQAKQKKRIRKSIPNPGRVNLKPLEDFSFKRNFFIIPKLKRQSIHPFSVFQFLPLSFFSPQLPKTLKIFSCEKIVIEVTYKTAHNPVKFPNKCPYKITFRFKPS